MFTIARFICLILFNFFLVPTENIATIEASAVVSEGVSRVRNALINGDYLSYDWDSGRNFIYKNKFRKVFFLLFLPFYIF